MNYETEYSKVGIFTTSFCQQMYQQQEIVFKKDKATLHVISKKCEDTKHF